MSLVAVVLQVANRWPYCNAWLTPWNTAFDMLAPLLLLLYLLHFISRWYIFGIIQLEKSFIGDNA